MSAKKPGEDGKETIGQAVRYDPDSPFRDYPLESTAARVFQSLIAPEPESAKVPAAAPEPAVAEGDTFFAPGEKKRTGAGLTREMIKRIADRAEALAKDKTRHTGS